MTPEQIARICHEANKAYCEALGDYSHAPWSYSDPGLRASVENGVHVYLGNPKTTPEESHTNWVEFKRSQGWTLGKFKDLDSKKHPCMVAFDDLPPEQQIKDALFAAICKVFIGAESKAIEEPINEEPPVVFPTKKGKANVNKNK